MEAPLPAEHNAGAACRPADVCTSLALPAAGLSQAVPAIHWSGGRGEGVGFLGLTRNLEALVLRRSRTSPTLWIDVVDRDGVSIVAGTFAGSLADALAIADGAARDATAALRRERPGTREEFDDIPLLVE